MMDVPHQVWRTPAVRRAAAAGQFGALIKMTRTALRMTQGDLGRLVGYSASTLSRIEAGQRRLSDVDELRHFADCLDIPHHLFGLSATEPALDGAASPLLGATATTVGGPRREGGEDVVLRRQLLAGLVGVTGAAILSQPARASAAVPNSTLKSLATDTRGPTGVPASVAELRRGLATARASYQACRYQDLALALPDVIASAQASLVDATGERHEQTAAVLADTFSLASNLCCRLQDDTLAWVTAERAGSAAQLSGQPTSIAEAARVTSIAMRRHGHHDTATGLLTSTALDLGADSGDPSHELLATYGALLCTASYTAAQNGNRHQAVDLIGEAETAGVRLGGVRVPESPFSPTNIAIYQIGVYTALGDAGTALDYAGKISLRAIPTPERKARFCIDTARAWHRYGNTDKSFRALEVAARCAPEEVRRPSVRTLINTLLNSPGRVPAGLPEFATRCGATT